MPLTKVVPDIFLPDAGYRTVRTNMHADGTSTLEWSVQDTAGALHQTEFSNVEVLAFLTAALATPGSVPAIDALKIAYPNLSVQTLPTATAVLRIFAERSKLGFTDS